MRYAFPSTLPPCTSLNPFHLQPSSFLHPPSSTTMDCTLLANTCCVRPLGPRFGCCAVNTQLIPRYPVTLVSTQCSPSIFFIRTVPLFSSTDVASVNTVFHSPYLPVIVRHLTVGPLGRYYFLSFLTFSCFPFCLQLLLSTSDIQYSTFFISSLRPPHPIYFFHCNGEAKILLTSGTTKLAFHNPNHVVLHHSFLNFDCEDTRTPR